MFEFMSAFDPKRTFVVIGSEQVPICPAAMISGARRLIDRRDRARLFCWNDVCVDQDGSLRPTIFGPMSDICPLDPLFAGFVDDLSSTVAVPVWRKSRNWLACQR